MDCEGCEKRIRRAISKLSGNTRKHPSTHHDHRSNLNYYVVHILNSYGFAGVDHLDIDMDKQKVTVTGYVDQRQVLKVVRRTGRKAEFWPYPYDSEYYPYAAQYLDESTYTSSYNYYMHGYNESVHGYFPDPPYPILIDDQTAHIFSDDNVHACSIMWSACPIIHSSDISIARIHKL